MALSPAKASFRNFYMGDEKMYLDHAVKNHGKKISGRVVDGVTILNNWLKTWDKRRWDFPGVERLVPHAKKCLKQLS